MTQATDIVLNGDAYMLAPGPGRPTYTRSQDGAGEGRTGRIAQTDFFGGTRRPFQLENDRGWASLNTGPAFNGQGVQPWPFRHDDAMPGAAPVFDPGWPYPSAVIRDYVYVGVGQYLYRTASISGGVWSAPTQVYDGGSGNIITGICYYGGNLLLAFGGTKDITHVVYPNATSPAVLFSGERGTHLVSYQGFAVWDDARPAWIPNTMRMVNGSSIEQRFADSPIRRIATAQADVIVATSAAVYAFRGRVGKVTAANPSPPPDYTEFDRWSGDLNPFFQHGTATASDDYRFILGFGGRTYAWVAKTVMEHDPNGDRAGWKDAGLTGQACHGACVAAGYLIVAITSLTGIEELWAFDGSGWWQLATSPSTRFLQPVPLAGTGAYDLMVPRAGSREISLYRLVPRSSTIHTWPAADASAWYASSMIDAGERDKQKAWRKIGAVFAAPERLGWTGSTDAVSVQLRHSTDAGATWSGPAPTTLPLPSLANHNLALEADIASDGAVSRFIQLRLDWTSVTEWAPVLVGLWTEYEVLDSPARRRRWSFSVVAQDQVIDRDDAPLSRTGRETIAELWQHWETGTTLPFRDIDYDDDPVERRVRIVGISEQVTLPHRSAAWGDALVSLTLVEV